MPQTVTVVVVVSLAASSLASPPAEGAARHRDEVCTHDEDARGLVAAEMMSLSPFKAKILACGEGGVVRAVVFYEEARKWHRGTPNTITTGLDSILSIRSPLHGTQVSTSFAPSRHYRCLCVHG